MSETPKTCPLCGATLEFRSNKKVTEGHWQCPTPFIWSTVPKSTMITHYTLDTKSTEYMYLPPFRVCNYAGFSNITKLVEDEIPVSPGTYVTEETITISGKQVMPWKHWVYVTKIPALKPEASDKMLERIKVLINFI